MADVSVAFAKLFAVKDEQEIKLERNAAQASVNAWNALLKKKIVDIVDQDKVLAQCNVRITCMCCRKSNIIAWRTSLKSR